MDSRVEQFEQIRRDRDREGLSIRGLAVRHGGSLRMGSGWARWDAEAWMAGSSPAMTVIYGELEAGKIDCFAALAMTFLAEWLRRNSRPWPRLKKVFCFFSAEKKRLLKLPIPASARAF